LPVVGKPVRPQLSKPTPTRLAPNDNEVLSKMITEMSEETKRQEALTFDSKKAENLRKMQDIN